MSDLGLLATQLEHATRYAEELDDAVLQLKRENTGLSDARNTEYARQTVKRVLSDLLANFDGDVSGQGIQFREETVQHLRTTRRTDWQSFIDNIRTVHSQLDEGAGLSESQLRCIEDIAQALDTECSHLFQRMQGRFR